MTLRLSNFVFGLLIVALGIYVLIVDSGFPDRAAQMPDVLAWTLIVLGLALAALNSVVKATPEQLQVRPFADQPWGLWFLVVLMLVVYGLTVSHVGFYEMSVPFIALVSFAMMWRDPTPLWRKVVEAVVYAVLFTIGLYLIFDTVLHVPTPEGLFI